MKKKAIIVLTLGLVLALAGCQAQPAEVAQAPAPSASVTPAPTPTPTPTPSPEPTPTQWPTAEDIFPREFCFTSGFGDWRIELRIEADGSFIGYTEARGWKSPEEVGKVYCNFSGRLSQPKAVNEYTYSTKVEEIETETGEEKVIDGVYYLPIDYVTGVEEGREFLIYLPDTPLEELPEDFLWRVKAHMPIHDEDTVLPKYGLYTENDDFGYYEI